MSLLNQIKQKGFEVTLTNDGNIEVMSDVELTDIQIAFLKKHKTEIIAELQTEAANEISPNAKQPFGDWRRFCRQCSHFTASHFCTVNQAYQVDYIPRHCDDWLDNGKPTPTTHVRFPVKPIPIPDEAKDITYPRLVTCWTPAGNPMAVLAKDAGHEASLLKMNPKPEGKP